MKKNELPRKVFSYVLNSGLPCKTTEIADFLDISIYQSYYYLQKLVDQGKIRRTPRCRGKNILWGKIKE
ncbi:FaeA/PapI family transcriptional regulator [Escherichia coli]|nr:FaeA/PapI family transcriptional regulator [Escherichia coli]